MSARGTTIAQGFSQKLMLALYDNNILGEITNTDYQGEINDIGSLLNIMDFDKIAERDYANTTMSAPDNLTENNGQLVIDKKKNFYWKERDYDNWVSYIKNPHPTIVTQTANERSRNMDLYVLSKYDKVGAGNRVGTDVTGGTVSIDTAGVVTGSGTAFTAAMVGRGFKATGHTKFYRVKTYSSSTSIVIEDDLDDIATAYTGGVISGATYRVEAVTAVNLTVSNILQYIGALKLKLDLAEKNGYHSVPGEDRWLIVPPEFEDLVTNGAAGIQLHVPEVYDELVKKGLLTMLKGFKVIVSNRLTGDNTNGYRILAGHPSWQTFAEKVITARLEEDLIGDFGIAYKDLFVYGSKVKDARRHFAAEGYFTFNV